MSSIKAAALAVNVVEEVHERPWYGIKTDNRACNLKPCDRSTHMKATHAREMYRRTFCEHKHIQWTKA